MRQGLSLALLVAALGPPLSGCADSDRGTATQSGSPSDAALAPGLTDASPASDAGVPRNPTSDAGPLAGDDAGASSMNTDSGVDAGGSSVDAGGNVDASAGSVNTAPGTDTPDAALGPSIANLVITPNPNNVLSCVVSFDTDVAARAEVRFGSGEPEFRVRSRARSTSHRIVVIGMHADTEYRLQVIAENARGSTLVEADFTTRVLPDEVPTPTLTAREPGFVPGWTLNNLEIDAGSSGRDAAIPSVLLMVDEAGIPVWYHVNGDTPDVRGDISSELLPSGNILIGPAPGEAAREIDLEGNVVWEGPPQATSSATLLMTHDAKRLPDGTTLVMRGTGGVSIEQYDADVSLLSTWTLADHFEALSGEDWCHGNSVVVDLDADAMYVNCRWVGTFKVVRSSGELTWLLAGSFGGVPGDFEFEPASSRFSDAHDPEFHDDGTVLLYDNGYGSGHSRVVEYALDEGAGIASLVWEFPGSFEVDPWYQEDWYTIIWGDADRLANGDVLVNAGKRVDGPSRIFEVTRDGKVVWELTLREGIGTYRAERVTPPLVERLPLPQSGKEL